MNTRIRRALLNIWTLSSLSFRVGRTPSGDAFCILAKTALVVAMVLSGVARSAPARSTDDRRQFLDMLAGTGHTVTVEILTPRKPSLPKHKPLPKLKKPPPKPKKPPPKPKKPPSGGGHPQHATPHLPKKPVQVLHP